MAKYVLTIEYLKSDKVFKLYANKNIDKNIFVNIISPALIQTRNNYQFNYALISDVKSSYRNIDNFMRNFESRIGIRGIKGIIYYNKENYGILDIYARKDGMLTLLSNIGKKILLNKSEYLFEIRTEDISSRRLIESFNLQDWESFSGKIKEKRIVTGIGTSKVETVGLKILIRSKQINAALFGVDSIMDNLYLKLRTETRVRNPEWSYFTKEMPEYIYFITAKDFYYDKQLEHQVIRFPLGLIEEIIEILEKDYGKITIIDQRVKKTPHSFNIETGDFKLRDYQREAIDKAKKYYNGIIQIATGGGKTIVAMGLIGELGQDAMIIVPSVNLAIQTKNAFEKRGFKNVGVLWAKTKDVKMTKDLDVNIVTVQSLHSYFGTEKEISKAKKKASTTQKYNEAKEMLKKFMAQSNVLIFDEAHHVAAETYQLQAKLNTSDFRFGLSATPYSNTAYRTKSVEAFIGKARYKKTASQLIKTIDKNKGSPTYGLPFLSCPIIKWFKLPVPQDVIQKCQDIFQRTANQANKSQWGKMIYNYVQSEIYYNNWYRNKIVMKIAEALVKLEMPTLIVGERVDKFLKPFKAYLKKESDILSPVIVHQATKNREDIFEKVNNGEILTLLGTTKLFGEGLDIPNLMAIILLEGGKSYVSAIQRLGRIMRIHDKQDTIFRKTHSLVIEILDVQDPSRFNVQKTKDYDAISQNAPEINDDLQIWEARLKNGLYGHFVSEEDVKRKIEKPPIIYDGEHFRTRMNYYMAEKEFIIEQANTPNELIQYNGKYVWE